MSTKTEVSRDRIAVLEALLKKAEDYRNLTAECLEQARKRHQTAMDDYLFAQQALVTALQEAADASKQN